MPLFRHCYILLGLMCVNSGLASAPTQDQAWKAYEIKCLDNGKVLKNSFEIKLSIYTDQSSLFISESNGCHSEVRAMVDIDRNILKFGPGVRTVKCPVRSGSFATPAIEVPYKINYRNEMVVTTSDSSCKQILTYYRRI